MKERALLSTKLPFKKVPCNLKTYLYDLFHLIFEYIFTKANKNLYKIIILLFHILCLKLELYSAINNILIIIKF